MKPVPIKKIVLILLCTSLVCNAGNYLISSGGVDLSSKIYLLEDTRGEYVTLDDVTTPEVSDRFKMSLQEVANPGFTASDYWIRFDVDADKKRRERWYVEIAFGAYGHIDLYFVARDDGRVARKSGGDLNKHRSEVSSPHYLFSIPDSMSGKITVYGRLSSLVGQATFPVFLRSESDLIGSQQITGFWWGGYYGILFAILIYHVLLAVFTRDRRYLLLSLYLLSYLFYDFSRGFFVGTRFIWEGSEWWTRNAVVLFLPVTLALFFSFYSYVLDFYKTVTNFRYMWLAVMAICFAAMMACFFRKPDWSVNGILSVLGTFILTATMALAVWGWKRGHRAAIFYFCAVVIGSLGVWLHTLNRQGALSQESSFLYYILNITSVFELILLGIGLAETIRKSKMEKRRLVAEKEHEIMAAEIRTLLNERGRIGEELHTNIGSTLLNFRQLLQSDRSGGGYDRLQFTEKMLTTIYNEIRNASHNMMMHDFEEKGLNASLRNLCIRLSAPGLTRFYYLPSGHEGDLTMKKQLYVFLVCTELTNNIIKHARATEASIRLEKKDSDFLVYVSDNGVGFANGPAPSGKGWLLARERLSELGGTAEILQVGKGTVVLLKVPFSH